MQHVVGVGGVCKVELALDGHTAAFLRLKAVDQDIIWIINSISSHLHILFRATTSALASVVSSGEREGHRVKKRKEKRNVSGCVPTARTLQLIDVTAPVV